MGMFGGALRYYKWQKVYRPEMDMCHSETMLGSREQPQGDEQGFAGGLVRDYCHVE